MEHHQSPSFSIGSSFYDNNRYNDFVHDEFERRIILEEEMGTGSIHHEEFTPKQLSAAMWITHITGMITFVSSLFVLWMAWNRRRRLFHRLAFGMAIHLMGCGVMDIWGALAVPVDTTNAVGNKGSITTCSIQGFLIWVTFITACFYYASFSIYGYVGTLNNFQKDSFYWMGKWIHIIVHIYPLCSGIYIWTMEGFNNSGYGYCFLETDPLECESDTSDYYPCERNNDDLQHKLVYMWTVPMVVAMLLPTAVMITLYFKVKNRQSTIHVQAKNVAQQAVIYLVALYLGALPFLIVHILCEFTDSTAANASKALNGFTIIANFMFALFGLWFLLMYLYFSAGTPVSFKEVDDGINHETPPLADTMSNAITRDCVFCDLEVEADKIKAEITSTPPETTTTTTTKKNGKRRSTPVFSFNIFDGTNASGAYSDFVEDGDSDDERCDHADTLQWNAIQNHV